MMQQRFTARDLICMASLSGKSKIYGVPDAFASVPHEGLQKAVADGCSALVDRGIADMDFDGKITLRQEYGELIAFCCECDRCLTLNLQKADGGKSGYIFWQKGGQFRMAEVLDGCCAVSAADAPYITAIFRTAWANSAYDGQGIQAAIPQIVLTKAKRAANSGEEGDCLRLLKQNGAEEAAARLIADGLRARADFAAALLMDIRSGTCQKKEYAFLSGRGLLLALGQAVVKLRSCVVFAPVSAAAVNAQMSALLDAFLADGSGEAL